MRYLPADYMQYGSTEDVKVLKFEQKFETQYNFNLTRTQPYTEFYGYYSFPTMITYLPTKELHEYSRPTRTSLHKYMGKPAVHISLWNCHDALDGWASDQVAASRASKFMQAWAAYHASPAEVVCWWGHRWDVWHRTWRVHEGPRLDFLTQAMMFPHFLHSSWLSSCIHANFSRGIRDCNWRRVVVEGSTCAYTTRVAITKPYVPAHFWSSVNEWNQVCRKKKSECKELVLVTYDCIMQLHSNIKKDYK